MSRLGRVPALCAVLILALATPAPAQHQTTPQPPAQTGSATHGHLAVAGAWARATPPAARTGAIYFTVTNDGAEPDRLVAAVSPAAAMVELHTHVMEGGVARMRQISAVEVSPGEPAVFQPGGLHVMLIDLRAPLRDGERVSLTLTFARAGALTFEVPVRRSAPAGGPPAGHHQH